MSETMLNETGVEVVDLSITTATSNEINATGAAKAARNVRQLPFKKLVFDRDRNPRLDESYAEDKIAWLARSIFINGLLEPLVVAERADGTLYGLKGHLRHAAILLIRTNGVKAGSPVAENPAIERDEHFMDNVAVVVMKGLTLKQELDILHDHGTTTTLTTPEWFRAVLQLARAGFNQSEINRKTRRDRTQIGQWLGLTTMPKIVEDTFLGNVKTTDENGKETVIKLPTSVMTALNAAHNKEKDQYKARFGKPMPFRTFLPGGEAERIWEDFLKTGGGSRIGVLKKTQLEDAAKVCDDTDIFDLLNAIAAGNVGETASCIQRLKVRLRPINEPIGGESVNVISEGITNTVGE